MPSLSFVTLDVFTQERYAGNPLAVVRLPAGVDVSTAQMQTIAREFNLSETIFLHDRENAADGVPEWRVRIFLTKAEIPFAGHPTIGAAVYALGSLANNAAQGRLIANAGPIELTFANGVAKAAIPHNFHQHTQYPLTVGEALAWLREMQGASDERASSKGTEAINIVSPVKGMNFVIVELPSLQHLGSITHSSKPKPKLDDGWNVGFCGSYFYVVTQKESETGQNDTYHLQTRMIEPTFEDPATGSAACALSCFIALNRRKTGESRVTRFEITQGVEIGRKSDIVVIITLNERQDAVEHVELSGSAVKVMEGVVEY